MHLLDTVSPLKTLGRGYSIIRDDNNTVIKSVTEVKAGDQLRGQLVDGEVVFAVTGTSDKTL
jgi:exodeoxyribonuclease VII large subunit